MILVNTQEIVTSEETIKEKVSYVRLSDAASFCARGPVVDLGVAAAEAFFLLESPGNLAFESPISRRATHAMRRKVLTLQELRSRKFLKNFARLELTTSQSTLIY